MMILNAEVGLNIQEKLRQQRRVIALVPARGGSKGIANKNMQKVGGESLLARVVSRSLQSRHIDEVWVSSDSSDILEAAKSLGARTHVRNPKAAMDNSPAKDVVFDFIEANKLLHSDVILYLQPTSPFRSLSSIDSALALFLRPPSSPIVGVRLVTQHPAKMLKVGSHGMTIESGLVVSSPTVNRQQLDTFWYPNGALYVFSVEDFLSNGDIPVIGCVAFEMDGYESMDVDTSFDLELCERVSGFDSGN